MMKTKHEVEEEPDSSEKKAQILEWATQSEKF